MSKGKVSGAKDRNLDLRGQGQVEYDYSNDLLLFKTTGRQYARSVEFENFVADIDTEGYITGLRLFDASKVLGWPKIALKNIKHFEMNARCAEGTVQINIQLKAIYRNRTLQPQHTANLIRDAPENMQSGEMVATAVA